MRTAILGARRWCCRPRRSKCCPETMPAFFSTRHLCRTLSPPHPPVCGIHDPIGLVLGGAAIVVAFSRLRHALNPPAAYGAALVGAAAVGAFVLSPVLYGLAKGRRVGGLNNHQADAKRACPRDATSHSHEPRRARLRGTAQISIDRTLRTYFGLPQIESRATIQVKSAFRMDSYMCRAGTAALG